MALLLAAGADAGRRGAAGLSAADYAAEPPSAAYPPAAAAACAAAPPSLVAEVMLPACPGHPGAGTTVVDGGIAPLTLITLAP